MAPHEPDTSLTEALRYSAAKARLRFHVPGHAGRAIVQPRPVGLDQEAFYYDVSEIDGVDVLSEPTGCLAASQQQTAQQFGVAHSFFGLNGASGAIQAAMLCLLHPGDRVLIARNAHRAVVSGLILTGAEPIWCLPDYHAAWGIWGGLSADVVNAAFEHDPALRGVIITSPSYDGVASSVGPIAEICRKHHRFLLVDEAHGTLWGLDRDSGEWPPSACHVPADAVIHAAHKGLGSLTQTGLLHLPHGSRIAPEHAQQTLNTLHSTSPSYLLLSSLDAALAWHRSETGKNARKRLYEAAMSARQTLRQTLRHLKLFEPSEGRFDVSRLFLSHPELSGESWGSWVEESLGLAYERVTSSGVLYAGGLGHGDRDWRGLCEALQSADHVLGDVSALKDLNLSKRSPSDGLQIPMPDRVLPPREAFFRSGRRISSNQALGHISKETVVHCPPGIPILMPGERIDTHHLAHLPDEITVTL